MSLVNQMLRDLKQRQGDGPSAASSAAKTARIRPGRPLSPAVLVGGGLVGLALMWWLAGVFSGLMYGPEPVPALPPAGPISSPSIATAPQDASVVAESAVPSATPVDPIVAAPAEAASSRPEPLVASPVTGQASAPVKSVKPAKPVKLARTAPAPRPKPAPAVSRVRQMHPDELPGAILNSSRTLVRIPAVKPSVASLRPATTPYGRAEERFQAAIAAYQANRTDQAVRQLREAIGLYPGHLAARALLADLYELGGRTGEAMYQLAEGLDLAPDHMPFKKRYVRLLVDQGDQQAAAIVMLEGGMPTAGDDPEAHAMLATLYQGLDEPFLAAQTYRNLLVTWPQTGAFWVGLGAALEQQGLPGEAAKAYRQALQTDNLQVELKGFSRQRLTALRS